MSEVQVGDRVRVSYEDTVAEVNSSNFILNDGTCFAHYRAGKGRSVEILERAKPKVGDVINDRRDLAKLSNGTVVKNASDRALVIRDGYTLSARTGFAASLSDDRIIENGPYVVIHVPPAQR